MRVLGLALTACAVLALPASSGRADAKDKKGKKSNADKIIGTWELVKSESGGPPGATLQFTKDGKVKMTVKIADKEISMTGTYKVAGDKLTVTIKGPDGKEKAETATIKTLTNTKLVTEDDKKKLDEFKKK